jgi:SAM-dependent methyltransferase
LEQRLTRNMTRTINKTRTGSLDNQLAKFWDQRYRDEGAIWGEDPSPTAIRVKEQAAPQSAILDVGFGYGRDMAYLLKRGHRVSGVDLSHVGQEHARNRFSRDDLEAEDLKVADYAQDLFPPESFDVIYSHRVAHLLTTEEAIQAFALVTHELLKPKGLFFLGVRDTRDLDPAAMCCAGPDVYEYKHRPGHRIRFWEEASFRRVFGESFEILSLIEALEPESFERPVPCRLTIMTARKS